MKSSLKIGVVGAGVFGGYHANKCADHPRTNFVGIYDPDFDRAVVGADKHNVTAFEAYETFLDAVDAVVIACPARYHGAMAIQALKAGKHCLIEKPIAATQAEGKQIVALAAERKLVVQVGHQERFVARAIGLHKIDETPTSMMMFRKSPYSERGTDVSVTLDLMTHDIDLARMIMGGDPDTVSGKSGATRSDTPDLATGYLRFGEAEVEIMASRVHNEVYRTAEIIYPSGLVSIDFHNKTLFTNTGFELNGDFGNDPNAKDSLGAATNAFIAAVLDGAPVAVSALDGYKALIIALLIDGDIK